MMHAYKTGERKSLKERTLSVTNSFEKKNNQEQCPYLQRFDMRAQPIAHNRNKLRVDLILMLLVILKQWWN